MNIIFFGLIILALMLAYAFMKKISGDFPDKESDLYLPYVKTNYLMSKAEHNFYNVLKEVVGDKYHIIPQVQLSKIVDVNKYAKNKQTYRNKIDRKSVDFVLFDKEYFSPYLVIELDEISHQLPEREVRDELVNAIIEKVGLRMLRVQTSYSYNNQDLSDKIFVNAG